MKDNTEYLEKLESLNLSKRNRILGNLNTQIEDSDTQITVFSFQNTRYQLNIAQKAAIPIYFSLENWTNEQIHSTFKHGFTKLSDFRAHLNKFGENSINDTNTLINYAFRSNENSFFMSLISIVLYITQQYYWVAATFILLLGLMLYRSYLLFSKNKNKLNFLETEARPVRGIEEQEILKLEKPNFIVPGDLVVIEKDCILPADCLILTGSCMVDESDLSGVPEKIMKNPLAKNSVEFNYKASLNNFIFQGSQILVKEPIKCVAVNTGDNTYRASNLQAALLSNSTFHLNPMKKFFFALVVLTTGFAMLIGLYFSKDNFSWFSVTIYCISNSLTPFHFLLITYNNTYFAGYLTKKDITVINPSNLMNQALSNTVLIDKTGTITSNKVSLAGFLPNYFNGKEVQFEQNLFDGKVLSTFYKQHFKGKSNKADQTNIVINFTECVGCTIYWNSSYFMDEQILSSLGWRVNRDKGKIYPKVVSSNREEIELVQAFPFSASKLVSAVIVSTKHDFKNKFLIKGAPEYLVTRCKSQSVPVDFYEQAMKLSKVLF